MKAAIGSVAVAAAVFVAGQVPMRAAASQAPATTTAKSSTADLDSKIEQRIHDSSLKKYNIHVSVNDGVATLKGTVASEADRRKAAELATISGISRVDNQLVVDINAAHHEADKVKGTTGTAESKVERNVDKGAEKTKAGVDKAIDKSADGIGFCLTIPFLSSSAGLSSGSFRNSSRVSRCRVIAMLALLLGRPRPC